MVDSERCNAGQGGWRTMPLRDGAALFEAFTVLERGVSVALVPPSGMPGGPVIAAPPSGDVWVGVTSSGSTGRPKLVWRSWAELKAQASRREDHEGWCWATPYEPWSFAGVQVAVQAWAAGGRLVLLDRPSPASWEVLVAAEVDALSCTPTFADLLLQHEPAGCEWAPRQVTLGGEPLRAATGARLRRRWPASRFLCVYASAELGILMRTHRLDGWYEVRSLEKHWPLWRVREDGVLEVAQREGEGRWQWRSTGDLVEVQGERLRVIGRADQVANVGGTKVSLAMVAECAEEVDGVRRAVAVAVPNAVTGQVVGLRYTIEPGRDEEEIEAALQAHLRKRLPKAAWPRDWQVAEVGPEVNAKRRVR